MPLTATVDHLFSGVRLFLDATGANPVPSRTTITRSDGVIVRGSDNAPVWYGYSHGYDFEAEPGRTYTYRTSEGAETPPVAVPLLPEGFCWLKSISQPALSRKLRLGLAPEDGREVRQTETVIIGRPNPVVDFGVIGGLKFTAQLRTDTRQEYHDLLSLLGSGVILFQATDCTGLDSRYVTPTGTISATRRFTIDRDDPWRGRLWSVPFVSQDRPPTVGSPLRLPGVTWETTAAAHPTWSGTAAAHPTWSDTARF